MSDFRNDLCEAVEVERGGGSSEFEPVAKYYQAMDFVLFLREDCSYRADRVDPFLTVLYHPHDDRIVGIKLKGFRFLFNQFCKIVGKLGNEHFLPLVKFVEIALVAGVAEAFIAKNRERIERSYAEAKQLVADVDFDHREVRLVA